jgi:hypothetical protein
MVGSFFKWLKGDLVLVGSKYLEDLKVDNLHQFCLARGWESKYKQATKDNEELGRLYRNKEYKLETKIIAQRQVIKRLMMSLEREKRRVTQNNFTNQE